MTTESSRLARGFSDQPPLMTRWHHDDLVGRLLKQHKFVRMSWRLVFVAVLLGVLLVGLTGCQSFPQAEASLRVGISANAGHAKDERLPAEARTIAEKNSDLMWKVLFNIGGCEETDIPADVLERQAARKGGAR